jgi:uncharacterized protein (TIGR03083 family)
MPTPTPYPPVETVALFPGERAALIELLESLAPDEWQRSTCCQGWTVHDLALHILLGDIGWVSSHRDRHHVFTDAPTGDLANLGELVAYINELNARWLGGARRISPRLTVTFLRAIDPEMNEVLRGHDLMALNGAVDWAGPGPQPLWLNVARQYTERWVHQQQIRDATGRAGLTERVWMHPVLDTFARALPYTLRDADAPEGSVAVLMIDGPAGGIWTATRAAGGWALNLAPATPPSGTIALHQDDAWRLMTKGITPEDARARAEIAGNRAITDAMLRMVTILA